MERDRDEYSGRFTREYSVNQFKEVVDNSEGISTKEVAEKVGCSRDLAYRRLRELKQEDQIEAELIGGSYRWYSKGPKDED